MFEKGLTSVTFRSLSPEKIIELCEQNGLTYIEWGSDVHAPATDTDVLYEIAEMMKKSDKVKCSSYGTYFRLGTNDISELGSYIAAAKILGTDVLRLWCGNKNYEDMTDGEWSVLIAECKKAAQIAEKEGVKLCMECHNGSPTNCVEGALRLMKEVASFAFRMYWQPALFTPVEKNLEYARAIAEYTENIHTFHWNDKEQISLNLGVEEWKKYLACFDGSQKLLLEFIPTGAPEALSDESSALDKIRM